MLCPVPLAGVEVRRPEDPEPGLQLSGDEGWPLSCSLVTDEQGAGAGATFILWASTARFRIWTVPRRTAQFSAESLRTVLGLTFFFQVSPMGSPPKLRPWGALAEGSEGAPRR